MARQNLKQVLMRDFDYSENEAQAEIDDAREEVSQLIENGNMTAALDICEYRWGLEPDYLEDFMI